MRATRRNVLVILGVLTIAGGALFGTGAFTQVEAQRGIDVTTEGDGSALLAMEVTGDLQGSDGDTISLEQNNINLNAKTYFNDSFTVTNNGENSVDLSISANGSSLLHADGEYSSENMYLVDNKSATSGPITLTAGETVEFDVVFDTTDTTDNSTDAFPGEMTVTAEEQP